MGELNNENHVKSLHTAFRIVEHLREVDGARITDIAQELELPKSTVYRHLNTLEQNTYIIKNNNRYYLSLKFLRLGEYTKQRKRAYGLASSIVEDIASETNERAQFSVLEQNSAVLIHWAMGERAVLTNTRVGQRLPLYCSSSGKAILSQMMRENVKSILDKIEFREHTDQTIVDAGELKEELTAVRSRGYSFNDEEYINGLRGVSVPIFDEKSDMIGALTVGGPANRLAGKRFREELPNILLGYANEFHLKTTYSAEENIVP